MRLLIRIDSDSELATYEGMALALTMATFAHHVQLWLSCAGFGVLMQPDSRAHGMLDALTLYDLPTAWVDDDIYSGWWLGMLPEAVAQQVTYVPASLDAAQFDHILTF